MADNSADQVFSRSAQTESRASNETRSRQSRARMPSSVGYIIAAISVALTLFFVLWWMLVSGGDEAPWLPAGLAASVVLLVAFSAREVVMRRAWTRYLLEHGIQHSSHRGRDRARTYKLSSSGYSAALRVIQKKSAAADSSSSSADAHLEVVNLCQDYLATTDEALRSGSLPREKGIAIRSGQQRVKSLHKHHLLIWARNQARVLAHEAQQKARMFDKVETANRAMDCIESALRHYPDEFELNQSKSAIQEFIASVKVAHWVELAERAAFKSQYRRAIERYRDALYYLGQQAIKEEMRNAGTVRIEGEIAKLQEAIRCKHQNKKREDVSEGKV